MAWRFTSHCSTAICSDHGSSSTIFVRDFVKEFADAFGGAVDADWLIPNGRNSATKKEIPWRGTALVVATR
jgi:hypothetical protein